MQLKVKRLLKPIFIFIFTLLNCVIDRSTENLEVDSSPGIISHPDIGLHFEAFNGHRYIPHAEKMRQYPEDDPVASQLSLIKYF